MLIIDWSSEVWSSDVCRREQIHVADQCLSPIHGAPRAYPDAPSSDDGLRAACGRSEMVHRRIGRRFSDDLSNDQDRSWSRPWATAFEEFGMQLAVGPSDAALFMAVDLIAQPELLCLCHS